MSRLKVLPVDVDWRRTMPIYACQSFLQSESSRFGWIGGVDDVRRLMCVLPYTIVQKPGLRMVRFKTATIPLFEDLDIEQETSFLEDVVGHFRSIGADIIIPSGNAAIFRTFPSGAAAVPYGTFIQDLSESEDVLMGKIRKTFRQNIRKAVAAGVQIKTGSEYLDVAYALIAATMKRSGATFRSHSEFMRAIASFGDYVKVFVAEHDGIVQGCMVAPYSEHTAYNCYAGSRTDTVLGSMHLLHSEAMRQFRAMGVQRFDFQGVRVNPDKGSKQEGILTYKQGFGGTLVRGYVWKYPLRRFSSIAYSMAVRLKMGGDIVDQERRRLRRIGQAISLPTTPQ